MTELLRIRDLCISYSAPAGRRVVIENLQLDIQPGECVAFAGESGSGKTTLGRACLGMLATGGRIEGGSISLQGRDISKMSDGELCKIRGRMIGYIPQDPGASLNPVLSVGYQVAEGLQIHGITSGRDARSKAGAALRDAGLDPDLHYTEAVHRLSGGMRQRVAIAATLVMDPLLLIADEPVVSLDITLRKKVMMDLRARCDNHGRSVILISHDLRAIRRFATRICVFYHGAIVEDGPPDRVLESPAHPYTKALLECTGALPVPIPGKVPDPGLRLPGCCFAPRCGLREPECNISKPALAALPGAAGQAPVVVHAAACPVVARRVS